MQQHNPSGPSSLASSPFSQVFPGARDFEVQGSQFVVVHGNMIHQTASSPMGFGPQQGLQTPQMIVPNTPSPETAVNSESGNYSNQLLRQGRGFPLYFPGPQINLAAEYRRTGVAIGDVGRVTPEGSFDFFFNIYLPANHPINANIPEDFVPLTPYNPVDVAHHKFDPGNYVSSPSVHKANDDFPESLFGIGSIFGGSASSGGKKYTEGVYVPSDGIVTDAFPIYKIFHPSQIIHERILRKAPGAKVVITHDDDWRDVFRDDGMEAMGKNLSELQDAIFDRFQIMEEDGAAFLMAKPHTTVSKDAADPLFERVIDADNMEVEFLLNFPDTQRDPGPDDHSVSYDSSSPHGNARGQDDKPPSKASSRSSTDTNFSPILAPDQPLTIQGKPPAHVVVACIQCQTRKIRCDGAEPMCNNCGRRGSTECNYYPLPERRGPDKMLSISARQRVSGSENEPALK
ncbi:hypothetical protein MVEN_00950900 [Mycena venus]|uniref:Zn(2)-C6 fungal-type domain-containing protein n=1 Tax=Mycena venus TaxID=2733690 RepID=A0A8H6YDT1_9AGAR|nr:hypothetical protein MVEN_00950900 [Mycena venus]